MYEVAIHNSCCPDPFLLRLRSFVVKRAREQLAALMSNFDQFAWAGICSLADMTQMSCSHCELQFLSTFTQTSVDTNQQLLCVHIISQQKAGEMHGGSWMQVWLIQATDQGSLESAVKNDESLSDLWEILRIPLQM